MSYLVKIGMMILIFFILPISVYSESNIDKQADTKEKTVSKEEPLLIKGDMFEVKSKEGVVIYTGNVVATHAETVLKCDKLRAYDENEKIIGDGNVIWVDKLQDLNLVCGHVEYERKKRYVLATLEPVLTMSDSKGIKTIIKSKKMEMFGDKEEAVAYDDVKIIRDDIKANCGKAFYYTKEDKVILTDNPVAWQKKNEFKGEKMIIYLKEERLIIDSKVTTIIYPEEIQSKDKDKSKEKK